MLATSPLPHPPTGTALTGDTPSAAIRRPGTRTHTDHDAAHPLGRHRHGRRGRRRRLVLPAARRGHRRPAGRPRRHQTPPPPRRARRPGPAPRRLPAPVRPGQGPRQEERRPGTSTATAARKPSPWSAATPAPAPRPTASTSSPSPPASTPQPRVVATLVDPKDRLTVTDFAVRDASRHRDPARLLVTRRAQLLPRRKSRRPSGSGRTARSCAPPRRWPDRPDPPPPAGGPRSAVGRQPTRPSAAPGRAHRRPRPPTDTGSGGQHGPATPYAPGPHVSGTTRPPPAALLGRSTRVAASRPAASIQPGTRRPAAGRSLDVDGARTAADRLVDVVRNA